jgi:SH3 domain protein
MSNKDKSLFLYLVRPLRHLLLATIFCGAFVQAENIYVTDMLRLDMYPTEEMTGPSMRKLKSGDRMDLLERKGRYARVRIDGGQEGWVKSLYLVEEEPARTRVNKLEQTNVSLEATVKKLRSQLAGEQAAVAELKQKQSGSAELTAATEQEVVNLREQNTELEEKMSQYASSVPLSWLFIAMVIALAGGIAGGWYFIDSRSRSKHGGYRIY